MHIYNGCCWILLSQTAILPLAGWKSTLSTFHTFISQSNWSNLMSCTTESLAIDIHTHHHHHTDDMVFRFACDDSLFFLLNFNLSDIFTGSTYSRICQFIFQPFLPVIELNSILFSLSFSDSLVRRFPLCFEIKWHHTQQIERRESERERESEILTRMTEWNTKKGMQFIFFIFHFGSATKESKSYTHTHTPSVWESYLQHLLTLLYLHRTRNVTGLLVPFPSVFAARHV